MITRECPICEQQFEDRLNSIPEITASFRCSGKSDLFPSSALGDYSLRVVNGIGEQIVVCPKCMMKVLDHSLEEAKGESGN